MSPAHAGRTAREVARHELTRRIVDSARRQLGQVGPAALSVRAVSRDLGLASSAVYRYFSSRDHLLTALLHTAYDEMGAAVEAAEAASAPTSDLGGRWMAICQALRAWALSHPHDYALLYGTLVPGYRAPPSTVDPATRATRAMGRVLRDLSAAGIRPAAPRLPVDPALRAAIEPVQDLVGGVDDDLMLRGLLAWGAVLGTLSLELFGHLNNGVLDYQRYFDHLVLRLAVDLGLRDPGEGAASPGQR